MELATSTSMALHDFVLSILIVISDILFRWVPAAIVTITGQSFTFGAFSVATSTGGALSGAGAGIATTTQVALEATRIDASGATTVLAQNGTISGVGSAATSGTGVLHPIAPLPFASDALHTAWSIFAPLSIFVSLLIAMVLVYSVVRYFQIHHAEKQALEALAHPTAKPEAPDVAERPTAASVRWARVEAQSASDNENDWRLAILEADIMLGDALTAKGFVGASIGEQLQGLTRGDLQSLEAAWDAHKVRNHIAHRGSMHDINQREAKRVIAEYAQVLRELKAI